MQATASYTQKLHVKKAINTMEYKYLHIYVS
jgi:hypothetical protein